MHVHTVCEDSTYVNGCACYTEKGDSSTLPFRDIEQ
jgi:hypothetical protein